jgi:hypothetical protein
MSWLVEESQFQILAQLYGPLISYHQDELKRIFKQYTEEELNDAIVNVDQFGTMVMSAEMTTQCTRKTLLQYLKRYMQTYHNE